MPYTKDSPPPFLKNLPSGAQSIFVGAFNAVFAKTNDDNKARMAGWGAVKGKYKKNPKGEWVLKESVLNSYLLQGLETDRRKKDAN